ncbi:ArsR family transcriptional regulator [Tumebacillus algifaecis]|uniref:ArsR family transcriptional regulator n=1 Tax=Tumebacillus algifaecis TaxID=1214604 RepID=A0A223CY86_9BACL|nr:metalloregulator ArsR/SmtB family transcription factor [Tumebacillus algifaecis]ASS74282.1 ArsR family transcriptional regulator [Tumebacillus algifaecis]
MQLDRMLEFHKALADANRLKIVMLLAAGPLSGQEIAVKLGLTPATVTHHMNLLRNAMVVKGVREKNTIYFYLLEQELERKSQSILRRVQQVKRTSGGEREKVVQNFLDANGRLKSIPSQRKKKLIIFEHLLQGLEVGHPYSENEINEYINQYHEDHCTIRREFVMNHYMYRADGVYTLNPPELWTKIE